MKKKLGKFYFIVFLIYSVLLLLYFFINPGNSGFLNYLSGTYNSTGFDEDNIRFSFYNSSPFIQLLYVLYGRIIAPLTLLIFRDSKVRFIVFLISVSVLVQSIERQNIFIILFITIVIFYLKPRLSNFLLILLAMLILGYVQYIKGGLIGDDDIEILKVFFAFLLLFSFE